MSKVPGFTAESAIYESTQRHYLAAGVGASPGMVTPAFYNWAVRSPRFGVYTFLCCLECWSHGGICLPTRDTWGCNCITEVPPVGGGSVTPDATVTSR